MAIEINKASVKPAAVGVKKRADGPSLMEELRATLARLNDDSGGKVGTRERMFFTERLALLLDTGVPLHVALESLASQSKQGEMARLLAALNVEVQSGSTFARALEAYPEVFPPTYVNLIGAAEQGGFLPVALERLRDMEERREELMSTLRSAISYPMILMVFSALVVIFVLVVVFPKFGDLFSMIHDQLPITTKWLMVASDVLRNHWMPLAFGLAGGLLVFDRWSKRPEGKVMIDRVLLATPVVRDIVVQLNVVQLLRVLGLSLEHGVSVVEGLKSSEEALSSAYFRNFVRDVEVGVNEGRGLAYAFQREPMLPDLVKQMVATGEESGRLPTVMARLADFYEREWRRALEMIAKIAEPAMLLIMGCVVGLIVSSLILPIFKLSRAVH